MDMILFARMKKEVANTAAGLGAVKGAPCTIKSITSVTGGTQVVFEWKGSNGATNTSTMVIPSGKDGAVGPKGETGETGPAGKDGEDGFSPVISVEEKVGEHIVSVTNKDGSTSQFTVKDGKNGTGGSGSVGSEQIATDEEVNELFDELFG